VKNDLQKGYLITAVASQSENGFKEGKGYAIV